MNKEKTDWTGAIEMYHAAKWAKQQIFNANIKSVKNTQKLILVHKMSFAVFCFSIALVKD